MYKKIHSGFLWKSSPQHFWHQGLFCFCFCFLRERGREAEREREKHRYARDTLMSCFSHAPNWGPGPQPRHVPWLGIEPATFWVAGWHSIHWGTPVRATPGSGLKEDHFSTDWGWGDGLGMIQMHYIQAHILLCSLVPNRPGLVLVHGPEVGNPCSRRW